MDGEWRCTDGPWGGCAKATVLRPVCVWVRECWSEGQGLELQQFQRVMSGSPLFPEPGSDWDQAGIGPGSDGRGCDEGCDSTCSWHRFPRGRPNSVPGPTEPTQRIRPGIRTRSLGFHHRVALLARCGASRSQSAGLRTLGSHSFPGLMHRSSSLCSSNRALSWLSPTEPIETWIRRCGQCRINANEVDGAL